MALVPYVKKQNMQGTSNYHPMHASKLFHQSILQLANTTQACIGEKKNCAMQTSICNAYPNATYKFMSMLPLLVCF